MRDGLPSGYKLALATLAAELLAGLVLVSESLGIFALLGMPLIGIAWGPAALMILSDLRQRPEPHFLGYIVAGICGILFLACLCIFATWALLGAFVT